MRIIAGTHRGRRLAAPEGEKTTRPITDMLKETLFNRLGSLGMLDPAGFACFDFFCGTGSLGLEAISRGAGRVTFVDHDRDAVRQLEANLANLGETDKADVRRQSATSTAWLALHPTEAVRMAFLDPPFAMMRNAEDRAALADLLAAVRPTLEEGGVVVLRGPDDAEPVAVSDYDGPVSATYGKSVLHFYQRPLAEELEAPDAHEASDADPVA